MSRRDKSNRFTNKNDSTENKPIVPAPTNSKPVVYDPDENEKTSYFAQIGAFFSGRWNKIASFSKSAISKTWSGLRKIPSYCVIRWDSENTESTDAQEPTKTAVKPTPVKADYDEDELAPSRWWNIGIKAAAVAFAVLIITGGYFGVKSLLKKTPVEVANVEKQTDATVPNVSQESVPAPVGVASTPPTQQASFPSNDPFSAPSPAPSVADTAPSIADPFGVANVPVVPVSVAPVPVVPPATFAESAPLTNAVESELFPTATVQPLSPLVSVRPKQSEPAQTVPQLQPLVAMGVPSAMTAAPVAVTASANTPVASNYNPRQAQRNRNAATFGEAPAAPTVSTIPQTTVPQTITMTEPVKEIVPQIPFSGTIQEVPPPIAPSAPAVAEVAPAPSVYANESAPAIPKDAPMSATPNPVVVVPVVPVASASEFTPQIISADSLPIDWQLWEQIQELRNETEQVPVQPEPTLLFTPREPATVSPIANETNSAISESIDALQNLLPTREPATVSPTANEAHDMASAFAALEDAPKPVYAEARPAYRNEQTSSERGMTFQSRIDSEVTRSPSETATYVVQQGDTYMTISDKFYGTSLLYSALAQHNQRQGIGWQPTVGVVVEVPTAEYLRMNYGSVAQSERRLDSQRSAVRYTVREGDTVFRLATDKLRDSTRWREIYAMNTDQLQDVRELKPGMEILLPVETARSNQQQVY